MDHGSLFYFFTTAPQLELELRLFSPRSSAERSKVRRPMLSLISSAAWGDFDLVEKGHTILET